MIYKTTMIASVIASVTGMQRAKKLTIRIASASASASASAPAAAASGAPDDEKIQVDKLIGSTGQAIPVCPPELEKWVRKVRREKLDDVQLRNKMNNAIFGDRKLMNRMDEIMALAKNCTFGKSKPKLNPFAMAGMLHKLKKTTTRVKELHDRIPKVVLNYQASRYEVMGRNTDDIEVVRFYPSVDHKGNPAVTKFNRHNKIDCLTSFELTKIVRSQMKRAFNVDMEKQDRQQPLYFFNGCSAPPEKVRDIALGKHGFKSRDLWTEVDFGQKSYYWPITFAKNCEDEEVDGYVTVWKLDEKYYDDNKAVLVKENTALIPQSQNAKTTDIIARYGYTAIERRVCARWGSRRKLNQPDAPDAYIFRPECIDNAVQNGLMRPVMKIEVMKKDAKRPLTGETFDYSYGYTWEWMVDQVDNEGSKYAGLPFRSQQSQMNYNAYKIECRKDKMTLGQRIRTTVLGGLEKKIVMNKFPYSLQDVKEDDFSHYVFWSAAKGNRVTPALKIMLAEMMGIIPDDIIVFENEMKSIPDVWHCHILVRGEHKDLTKHDEGEINDIDLTGEPADV